MRKKLLKSIVFIMSILSLTVFSSCKNEVDDVFDTPAHERQKELAQICKQTLINAEHGWKVAYEPNSNECFRLFMTFSPDSSYVTMRSDITTNQMVESVTSYYEFNYSEGPVLSFALYGMLTQLADPQKPYGGDNEFVIQKVAPDSISFIGRNNRNRVVFYKADASDSKYYFDNNIRFKNFFKKASNTPFFNNVKVSETESISIAVESNSHYLSFHYLNSESVPVQEKVEFDFSGRGFNTSSPIEIKGVNISDFTWNEGKQTFFVTGRENADIEFSHVTPFAFENSVDSCKGRTLIMNSSSISIDNLIKGIKRSNPNYSGISFYWDNKYVDLNSFSILITGSRDPNNHFYLSNSLEKREDQAVFEYSNNFSGVNAAKLSKNAYAKSLLDIFFQSKGFTVYRKSDLVYLVSIADSKDWLCFEVQ